MLAVQAECTRDLGKTMLILVMGLEVYSCSVNDDDVRRDSKFARARPHRCFGMPSYILTVNSIPSSCKSLFTHALRWKRANKTRKDFLGFILIDFILSWPGMFKLTWFKDFSQLASLPHFYWFLITFDLTRMFDLRGGHFLTVH
jgi:hypothetical protein